MALAALYDVPAPAKLNLFLHVVGRRADGYHLIESVFVLIDWCDVLHVERRADGRLQRHDLEAPLPEDDLCLRAARSLQQASGTRDGADISIAKRVPWGAGMGGGSSDAASTLLALNRLWRLRWPRERLEALALTLGADVPFFVRGRNAFVSGIGEQILPIRVPGAWYAVVKPAAAIETKAIFGSSLLVRDTESVMISGSAAKQHAPFLEHCSAPGYGRNDLQPPAAALVADVGHAAALLDAHFGNSRMTGSGSAVFARAGGDTAQPGAAVPANLPPGWLGRMCRGLDAHPLVGWTEDR
ncbi:MAG: 4-(cytidine 5'-diphospho)-2-C-methyl-D-erythritol kinase [Proteobacteria bacterium]|nr:4-(cytidine 5'-diphospho)-2-C-methyl-D-erythritol kinase [Pseudomonadota bacterium]